MPAQNDNDRVPTLTSQDIVKLFAVTFLPLCDALAREGGVDKSVLSAQISTLSESEQPESWAQVAMALATVLQRPTASAMQ